MAVFRVERNTGYTVMSNHHLRNKELSLKAKGLLTSNKVIENLQARLLSLVLDIRKIARGYIERVAYRFAALSVFFSRGFYGCPERLKVI